MHALKACARARVCVCVCVCVCVSSEQQWQHHMSSAKLRERWGDGQALSDKVRMRRLEWLGHLACMAGDRLPKQLLFARFPQSCPFCGPRQRWKDVIARELSAAGIDQSSWVDTATDRKQWRELLNVPCHVEPVYCEVLCEVCGRNFKRVSDMSRHKCVERCRPIAEQCGSVKCQVCGRWFRSPGGKAVHRCVQPSSTASPVPNPQSNVTCDSWFSKSVSGFRRHRCGTAHQPTASARHAFPLQCHGYGRRFQRPQDLNRHTVHCG